MKAPLPVELIESLKNIKDFDEEEFVDVHQSTKQITSVRINPQKEKLFDADGKILDELFKPKQKVRWCSEGFYLDERPQFIYDPLWHAGAYYVQEASSMFLKEVLQQTTEIDASLKVLDLCAAPGGKSTLLSSLYKNGLIVCNEIIKSRVNILYENITRWGSANVVITNNDAADFKRLHGFFDVMLIDAPCSGSGLFRKDEDAIEEWSLNNIALCSHRQQRIIADALPALKQDGILIYSTCSYSLEEDEDILDWMKDNFQLETIQLKLNDDWKITETQSVKHKMFAYRFWPYKTKGEGFFIAALQKKSIEPGAIKQERSALIKATKNEEEHVENYITQDDWFIINQNKNLRVIDNKWFEDVSIIHKNLYLKKAGILAGEVKGKDFVPHHELALSTIVNNSVSQVTLQKEQAINYLRKKEIFIDEKQKGFALSTYKNYPLGWLKILHNRVNNYYPVEWRILKV